MTANIFGDRFMGVRQPAWHKLGITPETSPRPYEGLQMIDGDFEIVKAPLSATVETLFGKTSIEIPGKYAIVREPTNEAQEFAIFGTCANDYEIIQRRDIANALDKLTSRWPVETIGMLGQGETVFFTLDADSTSIGGDEIKQYFLVTDTVDGKTSLRISFTPIRVVCQNTLDAGIRAQVAGTALDHRTTVGDHLEFHIDLIDKMLDKQVNILEAFEYMTQIDLSREEVQKFILMFIRNPKPPRKCRLRLLPIQHFPTCASKASGRKPILSTISITPSA